MHKRLTLRCYYHTDETRQAEKLDINFSITDCKIRFVYFYNIAAVAEYVEGDKVYAEVHCNGTQFICVDPPDRVAVKLEQILNKEA